MENKIGMIDSGLGGLLVLNACMSSHPEQEYIFIGDQLHAPYGEKTPEQMFHYVDVMLQYLRSEGVKKVIFACNTICGNIYDQVQKAYPDMEFYEIITPTIMQLKDHGYRRILVLSTMATANSHAYQKAIYALDDTIQVEEIGCPEFVSLIEGNASKERLRQAVITQLSGLEGDALILGCTHYPYLRELIEEVWKHPIYDSNQAIVDGYNWVKNKTGSCRIYSTLDGEQMTKQIHTLLKKDWKADTLVLDF